MASLNEALIGKLVTTQADTAKALGQVQDLLKDIKKSSEKVADSVGSSAKTILGAGAAGAAGAKLLGGGAGSAKTIWGRMGIDEIAKRVTGKKFDKFDRLSAQNSAKYDSDVALYKGLYRMGSKNPSDKLILKDSLEDARAGYRSRSRDILKQVGINPDGQNSSPGFLSMPTMGRVGRAAAVGVAAAYAVTGTLAPGTSRIGGNQETYNAGITEAMNMYGSPTGIAQAGAIRGVNALANVNWAQQGRNLWNGIAGIARGIGF